MAASDYEIRAQGTLATSAVLAADVAPLDSSFQIDALSVAGGGNVSVGMPALIGDEIVKITGVSLPTINVARGCADTIPAAHTTGDRIWLLTANLPRDTREYTATDTIGVKGLPFTLSGGDVPLENAPPMSLTFNWRFVRPYPPADVKVDGDPWFDREFELAFGVDEFTITWAHRDRVLQADQLVGHTEPSVGPEVGTTYEILVYDDADTLVRTIGSISGTSYLYTRVMAEADLPNGFGYLELRSVRDGYESLQFYRINIKLALGGLGLALGLYLGQGN
jgi:hypothetical protein